MWTMTLWHHPLPFLQWGVVLGASLAGAVWDLTSRRIPNRLTGPVLLGGLICAGWVGGVGGVADAVCGCLLLTLPYVLLFVFAGGGAGDAKLMGALGAWLGLVHGSIVLVLVVMAGAVYGLGFALAKHQFRTVMSRLVMAISALSLHLTSFGRLKVVSPIHVGQGQMVVMPYGIAIFTGVCIASMRVLPWNF